MSDFEIELNRAGVGELLKSDALQKECEKIGKRVLSTAGEELYEMQSKVSGDRCQTTVTANGPHGYYSNLKHNTLAKALFSAGGK